MMVMVMGRCVGLEVDGLCASDVIELSHTSMYMQHRRRPSGTSTPNS